MPLTETELKLRDAATQIKLALKNTDDDEIIRSTINAYISHARSITLIMQEESSDCPELKSWYEDQMAHLKKSPLLKFFNEKRVHTIHRGVVRPMKHVTPVWDIKLNGMPQSGQGTMTFWQFEGIDKFIPGDSGGVFRLCEQYFLILKRLVGDLLNR